MSYHDLSASTLTADERRAEANRILAMIGDQMEKEMKLHEAKFVQDMRKEHRPVSVKQLYWLRDLKDQYL